MLFSSITFIFRFLILFMILYLLSPQRLRNPVLLLGSLFFYGVGEPRFVIILMCSLCVNYYFYNRIRRSGSRFLLALVVVLNFALLFVFKYWDFAAGTLQTLTGRQLLPVLQLALPLGISFYTFQIVSLQIDGCRAHGTSEGRKYVLSFVDFATYIVMFPQLVAGPILRYEEVAREMKQRCISPEQVEDGFSLFVFGLGLKVLLANQIGTLWNTICSAGADSLSVPIAWLGAASYSFQIYFDFWGYSLMAVGLGQMIGFTLPENFRNPYLAKTMAEFWRRWHITLGRWFREYVYIPLGGSRGSRVKTVRNVLVVWALTGLWHGASWNFVIWGLLFFVLISLEKTGYGALLEKSHVAGHVYMMLLIPVTWVVFALTDFRQLVSYLRCMIGLPTGSVLTDTDQLLRYLRQYGILLAFCLLFCTAWPMKYYRTHHKRWYMIVLLLAVLIWSVYQMASGSNNPFLYFRF